LKDITPEIRRILWNALIRPHFEYIAPVLIFQQKTIQNKVATWYGKSFKDALQLPPKFESNRLRYFCGDLRKYAIWRTKNIMDKWKSVYPCIDWDVPSTRKPKMTRSLKHFPEELLHIFRNINFIPCKCGKSVVSLVHLATEHACPLLDPDQEIEFWSSSVQKVSPEVRRDRMHNVWKVSHAIKKWRTEKGQHYQSST
jgi:hypothetical protein